MKKGLTCILERFPAAREKIIEFYDRSEDFRNLCDDYQYIRDALAKCDEQMQKDVSMEAEYSKLFAELEEEVLRVLEKCEGKSD